MSRVIGLVIIAILALLAVHEGIRYRRAARDDQELPYPRRRLVRRLAITLIFSGLVALVNYWPHTDAIFQLLLLAVLLFGILIGLALLWRDLRETSLAVLHQHQKMHDQFGKSIHDLIEKDQDPSKK